MIRLKSDTRVNGVAPRPMRILLASRESGRLASLAIGLWTLANSEIHQAQSRSEAMELLLEKGIDLVVIDETLCDTSGLELARLVARRHPFVNCILVDSDSPQTFHEKTEGLGVVMQLQSPPAMVDAQAIMRHLAAIGAYR